MSRREVRAKRSRIMVELTPADYEVLNRWRATAADHVVNDAVLALMRAEQS